MSQFTRFMKQNKSVRENTSFAATKSLTDENGEPLKWTVRPLTTRENEAIREECIVDVIDENGGSASKLDTGKYRAKVLAKCVVEPDLFNAELQDSYGVTKPEDLIVEMIDNPTEYNEFADFVFKLSDPGNITEDIRTAKNS